MSSGRVQLSRSLLFPGPLFPISHFGLTLLRYVMASGTRYALYHLGCPPPERPTSSSRRLRPYVDGAALESALADTPGAEQIVAAMLDPGGAGRLPLAARRVAAAAWLHRRRQRLGLRRRLRARRGRPGDTPEQQWSRFGKRLRGHLGPLNDAFLGELVTALGRRAERLSGSRPPACLGPQAHRALSGGRPRLARLGTPDAFRPSWNTDRDGARIALAERSGTSVPARHALRGRFRELWREVLDELRELYLPLAAGAVERGLLERLDDAFFIPFELAGDLTASTPPRWLEPAVRSNRAEYEAQLALEPPPERLGGRDRPWVLRDEPAADLSPLWPLE